MLEQLKRSTGATTEEAVSFLDELVSSQVLVSELEPAITGEEFLPQLVSKLERLSLKIADIKVLADMINLLKGVDKMLAEMDKRGVNEISTYKSIVEILKTVDVPFEEGKLFQVDLVTGAETVGPPALIQQQLIEAVEVCNMLWEEPVNGWLSTFKKRFSDRYGSCEKPLLEVMDPECGIGFGNYEIQDNASDIEGVFIPTDSEGQQIHWTNHSRYLFDKIREAAENKVQHINLDVEELQKLTTKTKRQLPPSLSIIFRYFSDVDGNRRILFESCSGASAISLMARFAHADPAIGDLCSEIAENEQQINKDIHFAEIVHLPERRTGNILLHPCFREYEIPYLAQSSVVKENQYLPENLLVGIKGDNIFLRDKILGHEIIPRLSSAHNFSFRTLPAYHFLGRLQNQSLSSVFSFSWGAVDGLFQFYPRVLFKNTILSLATWKLTQKDLLILLEADECDLSEKMQTFLSKWNLPKAFYLSDGDNELLVYSDNMLSVLSFLEVIKRRTAITLKEFPCINNDIFTIGACDFSNQFIAPVIRHTPTYETSKPKDPLWISNEKIERRFVPGSEWIYVKIYCGIQQANLLITSVIQSIVSECRSSGLADKWFYIRYTDPEFHIRLRLHTSDKKNIPRIISLVHERLLPHVDDRGIWRLQLDTYEREIERYGSNTIEISEDFFCVDSDAVSGFLQQTHSAANSNTRTLWLLKAIDNVLTAYQVSLKGKLKFMEQLRNGFAKELNASKFTNTQIDIRFRKIKTSVEKLLSGDTGILGDPLACMLEQRQSAINVQAIQVAEIHKMGKLTVTLDSLLSGFIHMTCNRIFTTHARRQEFIIYDFLYRFYKSRLAISGNNYFREVEKVN